MGRKLEEALAAKFEPRIAQLLEAARSTPESSLDPVRDAAAYALGAQAEGVTARDVADIFGSHVVMLANHLVPSTQRRRALLAWSELPKLWALTDHGLDLACAPRPIASALGALALCEFGDLGFLGYIPRIEWIQVDVEATAAALEAVNTAESKLVAECIRKHGVQARVTARSLGFVPKITPGLASPGAPGDGPLTAYQTAAAGRAVVASLGSIGGAMAHARLKRLAEPSDLDRALAVWPPRECVRILAALRMALGEIVPVAQRLPTIFVPTQLVEVTAAVQHVSSVVQGHRFRGKVPAPIGEPPRDRNGRTFAAVSMSHWVVEPVAGSRHQMALGLPDGEQAFLPATVRRVMTGSVIKTYLACWLLYWEQRAAGSQAKHGAFIVDESYVVREFFGAKPRINRATPRALYDRARDSAINDLRRALHTLQNILIVSLGSVTPSPAQQLIHAYLQPTADNDIVYEHAQIAMNAMSRFTQIPRTVLTLPADDTGVAMALANYWRARVRKAVDGAGHVRESLRSAAELMGIYRPDEEEKRGPRTYWSTLAERLGKIMVAGELGKLHVEGEGRQALATFEPPDLLVTAYRDGGLFAAQDRAAGRLGSGEDGDRLHEAELSKRRRTGRKKKLQ